MPASDLTAENRTTSENVVERLRRRTDEANGMGFRVRTEWLDGQQATWCEIGGVRTIFVDLAQSAAEQLQQLEETLKEFQEKSTAARNDRQSSDDINKRAA